MEIFFSGDIKRNIVLPCADHEMLCRIVLSRDPDCILVDELGAAPDEIKAELRKEAVHRRRHCADDLLLVSHQRFPVEAVISGDADALVAVKSLFQLKRGIQQDLGIAAVVGAGAAQQIALDQCNTLAKVFQQERTVPIKITSYVFMFIPLFISVWFGRLIVQQFIKQTVKLLCFFRRKTDTVSDLSGDVFCLFLKLFAFFCQCDNK